MHCSDRALPELVLLIFGVVVVLCTLTFVQCTSQEGGGGSEVSSPPEYDRRIVVIDSLALSSVIDPDAAIEVIGEGFAWTEGPLWIADQQMLIFSDIPGNSVYSWTEAGGVNEYLSPSGYTGTEELDGEPGSNGLALSADGNYLLLCQHGDRRVARMEAPLRAPEAVFTTVTDTWDGKRFNSPNDLVVNSKGQIFFTDPPYGLPQQEDDPDKQIPFQGVFRVDPDGTVALLDDRLSRPNGIALSPDERTLYVANSDPEAAVWMEYGLNEAGDTTDSKVLYDATPEVDGKKGVPDGLKVNKNGILFATGPGGVWIFSPEGKPLGRLDTGEATANCAFNSDQTILFMCADDYLMRVRLRKM